MAGSDKDNQFFLQFPLYNQPTLRTSDTNTTNNQPNNMNKNQIGTLWVVATIIDTAMLIALCVTVGLLWK